MTRQSVAKSLDVSRETLERLDTYAELLCRWTRKINLVAPSTLDDLWMRHFLDSAQLLTLAPQDTVRWADLGSGGGFPGAVVAVLAKELRPELEVVLVESDQRKAAFLRNVLRETEVEAKVVVARIEEAEPIGADIVSARALASLDVLLSYADRHLAEKGKALFLKGKKAGDEVQQALEHWRFDCETYESKTDAEAVILRIGDIERV